MLLVHNSFVDHTQRIDAYIHEFVTIDNISDLVILFKGYKFQSDSISKFVQYVWLSRKQRQYFEVCTICVVISQVATVRCKLIGYRFRYLHLTFLNVNGQGHVHFEKHISEIHDDRYKQEQLYSGRRRVSRQICRKHPFYECQ